MHLRPAQLLGFAALLVVTPAFALHQHHKAATGSHKAGKHAKSVAAHWTPGQRGIDGDRTRAIQTALISKNYLSGQPSGEWDAETEAAMQKFQGDNGWQTKLMPDSRALIRLGLGPNGTDGSAAALASGNPSSSHGDLQASTNADTLASVHSIQN